jgi:hypothetical protein
MDTLLDSLPVGLNTRSTPSPNGKNTRRIATRDPAQPKLNKY